MHKTNKIFLGLLVASVFFSVSGGHADTARGTAQGSSRSGQSNDPLAPFLGHSGRTAPVPVAILATNEDPLRAAAPMWSQRQESSAESKLGWALLEMTQKTGEAAKTVKDTVKTTITDYVKEKQQQSRQQDLIDKFYVNLQYVTASLRLNPRDQQELTSRVQRVYIEDAESGRYQFDSIHFRELPYIVRREYSQIVLERTENGEAETYHLSGALKTHWNLKNGQPNGPIITYYENGEINFIDVFKEGRKIRRTKYDEEGKLVFEQNYEYSLPEESVVPAEPKQDSLAAPAWHDPQDRDSFLPAQSQASPQDSDTQDSDDFNDSDILKDLRELPPQASANHLEV